jgi:hypothetical protein
MNILFCDWMITYVSCKSLREKIMFFLIKTTVECLHCSPLYSSGPVRVKDRKIWKYYKNTNAIAYVIRCWCFGFRRESRQTLCVYFYILYSSTTCFPWFWFEHRGLPLRKSIHGQNKTTGTPWRKCNIIDFSII